MVQASHLTLLVRAYEAAGLSPGRDLARLGIAIDSADDPDAFIPQIPLWAAYGAGRRRSGLSDFGFRGFAQGGISDLGSFGQRLLRCATLWDLLQTFVAEVDEHDTAADFFIRDLPGSVLLCRRGMVITTGVWPIEQYVTALLIDLVRLCAGPDWMPVQLWLQYAGPLEPAEAAHLEGVRVTANAAATAIGIPRRLLALPPIEGRRPAAGSDIVSDVMAAIALHLEDGDTILPQIAESVGLPPRTLQRRLSSDGTSFQRLLSRARFEQARVLLDESEVSVSEVAIRLGYRDHGSFSRAFRTWAGTSPSAYRNTPLEL